MAKQRFDLQVADEEELICKLAEITKKHPGSSFTAEQVWHILRLHYEFDYTKEEISELFYIYHSNPETEEIVTVDETLIYRIILPEGVEAGQSRYNDVRDLYFAWRRKKRG